MIEADFDEIGRALHGADRILAVAHIRPDGDAVGALVGLGMALKAAGKQVQMALRDGVPGDFRHLQGSQLVQRKPTGEFDLRVVLDCSDLLRTGEVLNGFGDADINIDHHVTNLNFARLNLVEPGSVATSAILAKWLPRWGFEVDLASAEALLTGIITDSLGFRTSNMNPEALRLAAELMEKGVNLPELYQLALNRRSFEAAHYWGAGLANLQRQGRLVWTRLTLADRAAAAYPGNDDGDLINILSTIEDADVALIFIEQSGGHVKVSWRSVPGFDVSGIALGFGGGGHKAAAGADLAGSLEEVEARVIAATLPLFAQEAAQPETTSPQADAQTTSKDG
jgi:phosphoesterase RecJ-like protein